MKAEKITTHCEQHGPYEANKIVMLGREVVKTECPQCATEKLKAHQQRDERRTKEATQIRTRNCVEAFEACIPIRFKSASFDTFVTDTDKKRQKLNAMKRYADEFGNSIQETGGGLILTGNPGTGKTHLAIGLGRDLAKLGFFCVYKNLSGIIRDVRATWSSENKSEDEVINRLKSVDLLIIDEIGAQAGSDNERNIIFEIINGRYERVKPTVIISNYSIAEVADFISERSVDRITQGGGVLNFNWESQRGAA